MNNLQIKLYELYEEVKGWLLFDVMGLSYKTNMPLNIKFEYDKDKKNNTLLINSPDHIGLCTTSKLNAKEDEIINLVNDAIFTYFNIPRYKARQIKNKFLPNKMRGKYREFIFA